jgi:hypothetical protein
MPKKKVNFNKVQFSYRNNLLSDYGFSSYQDFLKSEFWRVMRNELRQKPKYQKCYCCGSKDGIELHHFTYKDFLDGASRRNIVPTCGDCHEKIHQISRDRNTSFKLAARRLRKDNGFREVPIHKEAGGNGRRGRVRYEVVSRFSLKCPKCRQPMERRRHTTIPDKAYYYTEWDYCKNCQHVQHYEEFKVKPGKRPEL